MMNTRRTLFLVLILTHIAGCDIREMLMPRLVASQQDYFGATPHTGARLERLSDHVLTFQWSFYRNLVIDTEEGLVVIDPINAEASALLKQALARELPGQPIHTLIYSHYHLDHTRGGAVLEPGEVIAHRRCVNYWNDFDTTDILTPTRLIEGDQKLVIGGMEIQLIDLGRSHTDTLYAFYIPSERLLYTVDLGLVQALLPMGHPDSYMPGVIAAMERLAALDFETFVPSHFGYGRKTDFLDYLEFQREARRLAGEAVRVYGAGAGRTIPGDSESLIKIFEHVYRPMKARYGNWHGFSQQSFYLVFSNVTGEVLGY